MALRDIRVPGQPDMSMMNNAKQAAFGFSYLSFPLHASQRLEFRRLEVFAGNGD